MEAIQHTFKRVEKKYVNTADQEEALLRRLELHILTIFARATEI